MSSARFLRVGIVVVAAVLAGAIGFAFAGGGIEVVEVALVNAPPSAVYAAIVDEAAGRTSWWRPYWRAEVRGDVPPDRVGSIMDISIRPPGRDQTVRVVARTAEVVPGRRIRVEYIGGDFVGEGMLTLEPEGEGTRVRIRLDARPTHWLPRLLSPVVRKNHSAVMRSGFAALDEHLRAGGAAERQRPGS